MNIGYEDKEHEYVPYEINLWSHRRWERPDDERYYAAYIEQDITGQWVLRRVWGSVNKPSGRMIITPCSDYDMAIALVKDVAKRRSSHHYLEMKNLGH